MFHLVGEYFVMRLMGGDVRYMSGLYKAILGYCRTA
jgi:hypothetical protein